MPRPSTASPELDFLRQAARLCPNVACVLTKIDLYPQWQRIAELDRGHLRTAGIDAELLPTSSVLRMHAVRPPRTVSSTRNLVSRR